MRAARAAPEQRHARDRHVVGVASSSRPPRRPRRRRRTPDAAGGREGGARVVHGELVAGAELHAREHERELLRVQARPALPSNSSGTGSPPRRRRRRRRGAQHALVRAHVLARVRAVGEDERRRRELARLALAVAAAVLRALGEVAKPSPPYRVLRDRPRVERRGVALSSTVRLPASSTTVSAAADERTHASGGSPARRTSGRLGARERGRAALRRGGRVDVRARGRVVDDRAVARGAVELEPAERERDRARKAAR